LVSSHDQAFISAVSVVGNLGDKPWISAELRSSARCQLVVVSDGPDGAPELIERNVQLLTANRQVAGLIMNAIKRLDINVYGDDTARYPPNGRSNYYHH
jgi:hypothetical protein